MTFRPALPLDELWDGERRAFVLAGRPVFVVRLGNTVRAYEDRCAHRELPVSAGRLAGFVLTCPVHEWQYDIRTGCGVNPRGARLRRLAVKIEDGVVEVDVEGPEPELAGE